MPIHANQSDRLRIGVNLTSATAQILVPLLPALGYGSFVGQQSAAQDIPIVPAGYAFGIWSVIFLLSLIYAALQSLSAYRTHPLFRSIGWYTAGAFFANTLWMLVAQFTAITWLTAIIIAIILAFALLALFRLAAYPKKQESAFRLSYITVSMLAGWVSAATPLNVASVFQVQSISAGIGIIIATALGAGIIAMKAKGNLIYSLAVVWALIAIIARQRMEMHNAGIALAAGIGIAIIAGSVVFAKWQSKE